MSGPSYRLYESCFGKAGREFSDKLHRFEVLAKLIPTLTVFVLAYLRELGARQWQDCEDVYFLCELLSFVSAQLNKNESVALNERLMSKFKIAVVVPFEWMVCVYSQVI